MYNRVMSYTTYNYLRHPPRHFYSFEQDIVIYIYRMVANKELRYLLPSDFSKYMLNVSLQRLCTFFSTQNHICLSIIQDLCTCRAQTPAEIL